MNVKDTVRDSLYNYPTIFRNKWDVYHHLFAVNGNGYEWVKGQLVDDYDDDDNYLPINSNVPPDWDFYGREGDFTNSGRSIYPLCKYACILNIPEDIQPDWKEAAIEFYNYLINNTNLLSKEDMIYLKKVNL